MGRLHGDIIDMPRVPRRGPRVRRVAVFGRRPSSHPCGRWGDDPGRSRHMRGVVRQSLAAGTRDTGWAQAGASMVARTMTGAAPLVVPVGVRHDGGRAPSCPSRREPGGGAVGWRRVAGSGQRAAGRGGGIAGEGRCGPRNKQIYIDICMITYVVSESCHSDEAGAYLMSPPPPWEPEVHGSWYLDTWGCGGWYMVRRGTRQQGKR